MPLDVQCLESYQFGSDQSTVFRPVIQVKLQADAVQKLQLLTGESNPVKYYIKDGITVPMATADCEAAKNKVTNFTMSEALQIVATPLGSRQCSVQIHTQLRLNLLAPVKNQLTSLQSANNDLIFGSYDLVKVMDVGCQELDSVNDPLLREVRAAAQDLSKINIL